MTRYPGALDSYLRISADPVADVIQLADWNDLAAAANALQIELGAGIVGNAATFGERIGVQLSEFGGFKRFEAGELTGYFSSGQGFTVTLETDRFEDQPQVLVCAQEKVFTLSPVGPSIFWTQGEDKSSFIVRGVRASGGDPNSSSSVTVAWLAYLPVGEESIAGEGAFSSGEDPPIQGWLDDEATG